VAKIVTVIPAYNVEATIGSIVIEAKKYVDKVVVVDDGSRDKTAEIARLAGAEVLLHVRNQGKGVALKTGLTFARKLDPNVIVCIDADFQHNPEDIPTLIAPILNGDADMTIASRFIDKKHKNSIPKYRRLGQKILTIGTNICLKQKITDSQNGFRAFTPETIDKLAFTQRGFSIESEMIHNAVDNNIRITEVPLACRYDDLNSSTLSPGKHGWSVLSYILKTVRERRPLLFFGVPGFISIVFGVGIGVYLLDFYIRNHRIPPGAAIISGVLLLLGVLGIFAGLILNSIASMIERIKRS
jgi:glycosyltransferase involved in cell wall biosynthesis